MKISWLSTITAAFLFVNGAVHAQEFQTLLGSNVSHGGFISLEGKFGPVDGHFRHFSGFKTGYIMNHDLYVGLAGYGMSMGYNADYPDSVGDDQFVQMGYGGLLLGYTLNANRLIHFGFETVAGVGGYVLTAKEFMDGEGKEDENWDEWDGELGDRGNLFIVLDPQLLVELNVAKYMRISAGLGYRIEMFPEDHHNITSYDQSGVTASLAMTFGKF